LFSPTLRKTTISHVKSVHPSFRIEEFGAHWMDLREI